MWPVTREGLPKTECEGINLGWYLWSCEQQIQVLPPPRPNCAAFCESPKTVAEITADHMWGQNVLKKYKESVMAMLDGPLDNMLARVATLPRNPRPVK